MTDEWKLFMEGNIPEACIDRDQSEFQIDKYWAQLFEMKDVRGKPKFPVLSNVVKCALILAHGNADTERSLSENKRIVTKERVNLNDDTINALRHTKDGMKASGGEPHLVKVDRAMLSSCRAAHSVHAQKLREEKEKKEVEKKEKGKRKKCTGTNGKGTAAKGNRGPA